MGYNDKQNVVSPDGYYKHMTTEENQKYSSIGLSEINRDRSEGKETPELEQLLAYQADFVRDMDSAGARAGHAASTKEYADRQETINGLDPEMKTAAQAVSDDLRDATFQVETADALHAEVKDKVSRDGKPSDWWRQSEDGRPYWTDEWIRHHHYLPFDTKLGGRKWNDYTTALNKDIDSSQKPIVANPDTTTATDGETPDPKMVALFAKEPTGSFFVEPEVNLTHGNDLTKVVDDVQVVLNGMMPEMETLAKRAAAGDVEDVNISLAYTSAFFAMSMGARGLLKSVGSLAEILKYQSKTYSTGDTTSADLFKRTAETTVTS